jgi:flagellar biosynthesis/type III secretory pathway protein FliH
MTLPGAHVPQALAVSGTDALRRPAWVSEEDQSPRSFLQALAGGRPTPRDPRTEARQAGYEEGLLQARASVAETIQKYQQGIAQLTSLRDQICRESEKQLVELALHIARSVIQADVEARRDFTVQMVSHAMGMLREAQSITLRVSPADAAAVRKAFPDLGAGRGVRLVEDRACDLGGVVAEADLGRIDARAERRLAEVARELLDQPAADLDEEGKALAAVIADGEEG